MLIARSVSYKIAFDTVFGISIGIGIGIGIGNGSGNGIEVQHQDQALLHHNSAA
jgi:hypothetical protein